jgi:outer membrane receptor protein involved in Fe transport
MLDIYLQVSNALDKDYATASQLGATGFTAAGQYVARPFAAPVIDGERPLRHSTFFAPGAPRSVLAGVRYRFGE